METEGGNDEIISQFMAFTSCADADKAASYLEMSGNNVETAVGLYMEHETGGGGGGASGGRGNAASRASAADSMMMPDEIRAPDATRTMQLMDDHPSMGQHGGMMMGMMPPGMDAGFHLMNAMMNEEIAQSSAFGAPTPADGARTRLEAVIAAQQGVRRSNSMLDSDGNENEDGKDDEDDDEDFEVVVRPPDANLTDIFSPPIHLMHRAGGFQGARAMAKDSKRWLLVNIQRDSEFSSHALNRDVWRDELVENLVREGFIFWQQVCAVHVVEEFLPFFHNIDECLCVSVCSLCSCCLYLTDGFHARRSHLHGTLPSA